MKKTLLLALLTPMMLGFVSGCGGTSGMKLTYGTYITSDNATITDAKEIELGDLITRMDRTAEYANENFILVVAPTNGCLCWEKFKPVLKNFIKETHYLVYQIKITEFGDEKYGIPMKQGSVALSIIKAGKVVKSYVASSIFDSTESLKAEINKYVRAPELYYVDEEKLDSIIKGGENALIGYVRCNCSDCNYSTPRALWNFAYTNSFKTTMYIYDMEDIRNGDPLDYQEFKDVHYLSNKLDQDFGYIDGRVPTIHYYERGKLIDATVFFNDTVEKVGDIYKITESFYSAERAQKLHYLTGVKTPILEGIVVPNGDIDETGKYWRKEKAYEYHKPLFDAFMNKYAI